MSSHVDPTAVDLHDGIIRDCHVDFLARTISLFAECYIAVSDAKRSPVCIRFRGVSYCSGVTSFDSIGDNSTAGNINYWNPVAGGLTFVYLNEGCLAVAAREVTVEINAP